MEVVAKAASSFCVRAYSASSTKLAALNPSRRGINGKINLTKTSMGKASVVFYEKFSNCRPRLQFSADGG